MNRKLLTKLAATTMTAGSIALLSPQFELLPPPAIVHAELKAYTGTGFSLQSDRETGDIAKKGARLIAIQAAREQAGVFLASRTEVKNASLTSDEIAVIAANIVSIDEHNIKYEKSIIGDDDISTVKYKATVTVHVDTDSLQENINLWRKKDATQKRNSVSLEKGVTDDIKALASQAREVEQQIIQAKTDQEKDAAKTMMTQLERNTLAMQKMDEALKSGNKGRGDFNRMLQLIDEALALNPDYGRAYLYNNRAAAYYFLRNPQKAIENLNKAIEIDPNDTTAYHNLASVYVYLGNANQAIANYWKASP
ncbi:MAG: tetratricopeptide repeat protein [Selenomonadaceae bacterium]|nr:tetratricopeptide repeat protein [Selenomonadaceae bacterium]